MLFVASNLTILSSILLSKVTNFGDGQQSTYLIFKDHLQQIKVLSISFDMVELKKPKVLLELFCLQNDPKELRPLDFS